MNQELPVQMHPRYNEFLQFMQPCPHRKTPSTLETAFWAWLESQKKCFFCDRPDPRDEKIKLLKSDLDRLHRECDNFQMQCAAMAEENYRIKSVLFSLEQALNEVRDE